MFKKIIPLVLLALVIYACGSDSSSDTPGGSTDNFDRGALLAHTADNIIIPAFQNFSSELNTLKSSSDAFTATPDASTLATLRTSWLSAYKAWQHVAMYDLGKAEEFGTASSTERVDFSAHFNIYPTASSDIESNIASGSYDFNTIPNYDTQGFPALDYLLYGVGAEDTAILAKYTTDANATNYKKYITDIVAKMIDVNSQILNDWTSSYRNQFVSSTGNTLTSSFNKLINDYIFNYEKKFRANKIGIPVGVFSNEAFPAKVEGYYKRTSSKELALEAMKSIENVFNGRNFNGNGSGPSFKSYLDALNRSDIATSINNQLGVSRTRINALNDNLSQQITDDEQTVLNTYIEIQKVVPMLKVDALSALNVAIDYRDADGD